MGKKGAGEAVYESYCVWLLRFVFDEISHCCPKKLGPPRHLIRALVCCTGFQRTEFQTVRFILNIALLAIELWKMRLAQWNGMRLKEKQMKLRVLTEYIRCALDLFAIEPPINQQLK